jgi:glycosyltransferase involved in cell wall biosynthesis
MALFPVDVIVRTYNRSCMIEDAIASVMAADRTGIELKVLIVDNNSTDDTPAVLAQIAQHYGEHIQLLVEPRPGGQMALNAGIAATTAPVIAFFDDDERVSSQWLQIIAREFSDQHTDFIAGPYVPVWKTAQPDWIPPGFSGALGIIDSGPIRRKFTLDFNAMLTQGNCAVRREIFDQAGPYPPELKTAEDRWLFAWLMAHDKTGYYCPEFSISHMMQESRLSREYFRKWAKREGRDVAVCQQLAGEPSFLLKGWYWRRGIQDVATLGLALIKRRLASPIAFGAELRMRVMAAYIKTCLSGYKP